MKLIEKLKDKIRCWIGINEELRYISDSIQHQNKTIRDLELKNAQLEKDLNLIKSTCDIGVDVHERTDSWAVICIAGNKEYVKFVKLEARDAREVMYFLKRFESSNSRLIDAPYAHIDFLKW